MSNSYEELAQLFMVADRIFMVAAPKSARWVSDLETLKSWWNISSPEDHRLQVKWNLMFLLENCRCPSSRAVRKKKLSYIQRVSPYLLIKLSKSSYIREDDPLHFISSFKCFSLQKKKKERNKINPYRKQLEQSLAKFLALHSLVKLTHEYSHHSSENNLKTFSILTLSHLG